MSSSKPSCSRRQGPSRGASNAVLTLKELLRANKMERRTVCVTSSSGNHGQALALAASRHGFEAVVVVPKDAPVTKRNAILGYGAKVVDCEASHLGRINACQRLLDEMGDVAELVPSSDHPFIACGQGTIAVEMLEQVPHLDALVVSVGAGGMLAGIAVAAKAIKPTIKVFAAEPLVANDVALSFAAKKRVVLQGDLPVTVADGLRTNVGEITWPLIEEYVDGVITVEEDAIVSAMELIWQRMKVTAEASAAIGLAAIQQEARGRLSGHRSVGMVLCGGNVSLAKLPWQH